jgi:hypothetical protein
MPYAYRIEALRRAIRYREDYVLRHARRLARREEKSRLASLHEATTHHPHPAPAPAPRRITPRNAKHEDPG